MTAPPIVYAALQAARSLPVPVPLDWPNLILNTLGTVLLVAVAYLLGRRNRAFEQAASRLSVDSLGDAHRLGWWRLDGEGTITASGGALSDTGYRTGELVGEPVWQWAPPGSDAEAAYKGAIERRVPSVFDNDFRARNGARRVWRIRVDPLADGGAMARGVGVTDLYERAERAEAEAAHLRAQVATLREGQERIRRALDADLGLTGPGPSDPPAGGDG